MLIRSSPQSRSNSRVLFLVVLVFSRRRGPDGARTATRSKSTPVAKSNQAEAWLAPFWTHVVAGTTLRRQMAEPCLGLCRSWVIPVLGPDSIFLLTKEPAMTRHADTFAYSCKRGCQEHLSVFARDVDVVRGIQPLSVMRDAGFGVLCLMNVAAWVVPSQSLHSGCDDAVVATRGPVLFWGRHEALAAAADDLFEGSCAIRFGNLSCFVSLDD